MNAKLTDELVVEVLVQLKQDGIEVTSEDVRAVAQWGSVDPGVVGEEHDEARSEAILEALGQRGIEV